MFASRSDRFPLSLPREYSGHAMALTSGMKLGPCEIVSPLGAGGMGEVYRTRDTRLDRIVAIKVLPESLAKSTYHRG